MATEKRKIDEIFQEESEDEHDQDPPQSLQPRGEPGSLPDGVPQVKYSFETPPPPIPNKNIREILTAEVVVVSGGLAGTSAALAAAEAGARTVLIERTAICQQRGGDIGIIGSRLQKKLGIEIDPNEVCLELMKYSANKPDQRLLRLWANHSGEAMDWLMDMTEAAGMESSMFQFPPPAVYNPADNYYPQYQATHNIRGGAM